MIIECTALEYTCSRFLEVLASAQLDGIRMTDAEAGVWKTRAAQEYASATTFANFTVALSRFGPERRWAGRCASIVQDEMFHFLICARLANATKPTASRIDIPIRKPTAERLETPSELSGWALANCVFGEGISIHAIAANAEQISCAKTSALARTICNDEIEHYNFGLDFLCATKSMLSGDEWLSLRRQAQTFMAEATARFPPGFLKAREMLKADLGRLELW